MAMVMIMVRVMVMVLVNLLFEQTNYCSPAWIHYQQEDWDRGCCWWGGEGQWWSQQDHPFYPSLHYYQQSGLSFKKSQLLILCSGWCLAARSREASGGGEPRLEPRVGAELVGNDPTVFRYMDYTVTELSSNIKNRTKKKSFSFVHISKSALLYVWHASLKDCCVFL